MKRSIIIKYVYFKKKSIIVGNLNHFYGNYYDDFNFLLYNLYDDLEKVIRIIFDKI